MYKRDRFFGLGLFIVLWFFFTVIFILNTLSKNIQNDETNDGVDMNTRVSVQARLYSEKHRPDSTSTVPPVQDWFSYERYSFGRVKSHRLESMVKRIMAAHKRPEDDYYSFNVTKSDETSINRDIPDLRPSDCTDRKYNYSSLPTFSVVTPVHNEALTSLLRHIHAILIRTPPQLLQDIILVDDNSNFTYLGDALQEYVSFLDSKITIIRNKERKGLISARLQGADIAKGEVIIFLDAHMEVCEGWVEPLLERISRFDAIVVQADIIGIDAHSLEVKTGAPLGFRGGFGWDMRYVWLPLQDYIQITRTPWDPAPVAILQGSCIAIRKSYFDTIGRFDPGLEIWGGEHFEMSFNVWMTGGRVETVPCSKVGHIYKTNKYSFGIGEKMYIIAKNCLRVGEVWMDEYKKIMWAGVQEWQKTLPNFSPADWISIEERRQLRSRRQSKSFDWYLKTVLPELKIPEDDDLYFGEVQNLKTKWCWHVLKDGYIGMSTQCDIFVIHTENTFALDRFGRLRYESKCVGFDEWSSLMKIQECPCKEQNSSNPRWSVDKSHIVMTDGSGKRCATEASSNFDIHRGEELVQLQGCDESREEQNWSFMFKFKSREQNKF